MSDKFINVPVDQETKILFQQLATLGEFEVLYQKWFWDGITAESIIFANQDVTGLGEEDIKNEVRSSPLVNKDSKITFNCSDSGFTFVNFNFETE